MKINCETKKGGAVTLNEKHGVICSYAVASVGEYEPDELLYTYIALPHGRKVQFFVNRETGLVVVDIINRRETRGNEILRVNANEVKI